MGLFDTLKLGGLFGSGGQMLAPLPDYAGQAAQTVNAMPQDPPASPDTPEAPSGHRISFSDMAMRFARAQALVKGDYGAAAQITAKMQSAKQDAADQAQKDAATAHLNSMINSDPELTSPQAKAYAMANPKAYIDAFMDRYKTRQFGPEGGSVAIPGANGFNWTTAPRFTNEGTIYAPGDGTSVPKILQRGAKMEPIQAGGHLDTVDPLTGRPITQDGGVLGLPETHPMGGPQSTSPMQPPHPLSTFQPGQVVNGYLFKGGDDTDQANWELVGGAGRNGPPTFPQ